MKAAKNDIVTNATRSRFDKREMTINDILEHDIKFASMVFGYKIYYSSRENFIYGTTIYAAYEMMRENKKYDLYELLHNEMIKNLKKIKENKKHPFKYRTLLLCLFFYFMNEVPRVGQVQWTFDRLVGVQTVEYLYNFDDSKVQNTNLWGYFNNFQKEMHERETIPMSILEKYQDTICFMVNIDECLMKVVEPRTSWIIPIGYEVEEKILELYAQHLLGKPMDPNEEIFGTYK